MNFDALSESQKMTFSTRDCQSRHAILYVNFLRTCRTNFHACRSRDDQTRPLFERANCQFLKKKDFRCKVRISKKRPFLPGTVNHDMSFCTSTSSGPRSRDDQTRPLFERANCQFLKKMNFDALSESQKMTFSTRDCQSRHVILYVNFLRTCRKNLHACGSRDDQTRPLFERANCQFLKKKEFRRIVRISKNDLFYPGLSITTCHSVRQLPPDLPDKFSRLPVTRRPNSTPV